jgi:hypothetical protein
MASSVDVRRLDVSLDEPSVSAPGAFKAINIDYSCDSLSISFRRTVRVPDNGKAYDLPPDSGPFPIYSINEHKENLPNHMVSKGGVFVPIYGRFGYFQAQ